MSSNQTTDPPSSTRLSQPLGVANLASKYLRARAAVAAILLLTLTACMPVKLKLGWKLDLAKTPVASMDAKLVKAPAMSPGQKSSLIVTILEPNGKAQVTEGKGGGKIRWQDLKVIGTVVTVNQKGSLTLAHDPRISDGKTGHITVTTPSHPDMRADLDIPFRYDVAFTANFSGSAGAGGMSGTNGMDGSSGSSGSTDPNSPSAGGDGGNGSDGSDGGDGGPGGDALPVQVSVALQSAPHPLLQVKVSSHSKERYYLVDPEGGSLTVHADGGAGGSGGSGGRGGRGGSGGSGSPSGSNGLDGHDGRNGWDGPQGRGGLITVTYDPQVQPYLNVLHFSSQNGPSPVLKEGSVAQLW